MAQSPEIIFFQFFFFFFLSFVPRVFSNKGRAADVEGKLLLLFNFYGLVKISPTHTNCQRHQILLVLLFVWSGKRPFKGVCRFMSACYYVTRRSTWELSVRPFLFSNKYRALCERKYKLLGQLKQWDSNEYMFIRYNQSVLYVYTITTIYCNRSQSIEKFNFDQCHCNFDLPYWNSSVYHYFSDASRRCWVGSREGRWWKTWRPKCGRLREGRTLR